MILEQNSKSFLVKKELMDSRKAIIENNKLLKVLCNRVKSLDFCYLIDWVPDVNEDIYIVLELPYNLFEISICRDDKESIVEIKNFKDYFKKTSKRNHIKITEALKLYEKFQ